MPRFPAALVVFVCGLVQSPFPASALEREPNTTLALPQDPERFGFSTEPAFGQIRFINPVAITTPPGETNRLFVVEQGGIIAVIPDLSAPERNVFLNISSRVAGGQPNDERGLLGLAFHPGYATNGFFYVYYSTTTNGALHQRLSRFTVSQDPNQADAESEVILISQLDQAGNHNGGDVHFGPDGYLYVSLGDEGGANDSYNNSQYIDRDFHSGIIRIDVDLRPGNLPPNPHPAVFPETYAVPADNPWVGATEFNGRPVDPTRVRTEFWAVGLRNPWRMSFDPVTGQLWTGDVGQNRWEEIDLITRGGNYGWAYLEGTANGPRANQAPPDFMGIPPVVQYAHGGGPMRGNSVTGGVVYRGQRLSQLTGAYVFADYVSGNIWAIRYEGSTSPPMQRLTGRNGVAGMGYDPRNGDVLLADQAMDTIARLTYSETSTGTPLPPTLAETGAFADLATLQPEQGIIPYEINVPFWSDGAIKQRWFSLPDTNQFITFAPADAWSFPAGAVWIKHFELELTNGVPESRRRLETRFIVRNEDGVYGVTYRWTDPPTNAVLVAEEGLDETFVIHDGGILRTQVWHYPSRAECLQCHTRAAGMVLGFNTRQLNRDVETDSGPTNQLSLLAGANYFENPPEDHFHLPALAAATNELVTVEWRVRSWLDANCSQCHRPGGPALGQWDARSETPLSQAGLIHGPLVDDEGNPENRVVVPGSLPLSMLHSRITRLGPGRMPPLASSVVDESGAALISRWITNDLPAWQSFADWQATHFEPDSPEAAPELDPDADGSINWLEYLTGTDPTNAADVWKAVIEPAEGDVVLTYQHLAGRGFSLEWTDAIANPDSWRPVHGPANRFFIAAEPFENELRESAAETARFYRVRVFEP